MKWQVDQMTSWWNDKLMKWQVDEMTSWWNDKLMKWQVDEMTSWPNDKLMKWQVDKIISWPMTIYEMTSWPNVKMTKWQVDQMSRWPNDKLTKWPSTCHFCPSKLLPSKLMLWLIRQNKKLHTPSLFFYNILTDTRRMVNLQKVNWPKSQLAKKSTWA